MLTAEDKHQLLKDLEDPVYRKQFYGKFLGVPDWRTWWDKLNAGAFNAMCNECQNEMSLEQLGYCANRHASLIRGAYVARPSRPRPLKPEALYVWVIYWLYRDGVPEVPVYVGMTRQLSERWTAHKNGTSEIINIDDLKSIRITVVETVCGGEREARIAERKRIAEALIINPKLLNKAAA